jgi:hypothetical protein
MRAIASAALALVLATCVADMGAADTGSGALAAEPAAADLIRVSCFDDGSGAPASLVAQISDELPVESPLVSVQILKASAATNTTDPVDGDGLPSPLVFVDGGAGDYEAFVDKSGSGVENYLLTLQCMTGAGGLGVPTGTFVEAWTSPVPVVDGVAGALLVISLAGIGAWRLIGAAARRSRTWV